MKFFSFDHLQHIFLCFIIFFMSCMLLFGCGAPLVACLIGGFMTAMSAGITKEWMDKEYGGKFDFKDILADVIGAALAAIASGFMIYYGD